MQTLADSLKAEDKAEGILETAKNMFRQKLDINIIRQVTGMPLYQLQRIAV